MVFNLFRTMSTQEQLVGSINIGNTSNLSEKLTLSFTIHEFENFPHDREIWYESPFLPCHNYLWALRFFPGGSKHSDSKATFTSMFLCCKHSNSNDKRFNLKTKFAIRVRNNQKVKVVSYTFKDSYLGIGFHNFMERSTIIKDNLENGSLTVKIDIQIYLKEEDWTPPKRNFSKELSKILDSGKFADLVFQVGERQFHAHRLIIAQSAPVLIAAAENVQDKSEVITIESIDPYIFQIFLHFVYTDEDPHEDDFKIHAKDLLEVANRFGCIRLKLLAEIYLAKHVVSKDNAIEMMLFADERCCAQLKEAAMKCFAANPEAVIASEGWREAKKKGAHFATDLFEYLFKSCHSCTGKQSDHYNHDTVTTLRRKLEANELDVDGTRDMLVKRLKTREN